MLKLFYMKWLLIFAFLLPVACISQELIIDKTDEFTKTKILRTSWEPLTRKQSFYCFVQASKLNNDHIIAFKINLRRVFSIHEGDAIFLKLANDSIVTLRSTKSRISCRGCAEVGLTTAYMDGIELSIPISPDTYEILTSSPVTKIRINTSGGYIEEEIKEKAGQMILKELKLVK